MVMVARLCTCHMAFSVHLFPPPFLSSSKPSSSPCNGGVFRWQSQKRRLQLVVNAELSKSFSLHFGLHSQNGNSFQSHDSSQLPWIGPIPGDIAELEAYCRIFRSAERLHSALMDALCNPLTGECSVSYDVPSHDKPQLEDKIVSVLGCMVSLMNKGREDVLSGRSSVMNSFHTVDASTFDDNLPPLAVFRSEMKRCCVSLHVALQNYLTFDDDGSIAVWRKLQRLKNICYDLGFPRKEHYPCHTLFANWSPVYFSTSTEKRGYIDSETVFWKGGQVTEEGLKWLLDKGYKTIIDLRAETVKDNFYQAAIHDAIASGKIELVKIPVEAKTAPTIEQVVRFASYVSDGSKRPIYLHSEEGVWRTSAMISRWRQYISRSASHLISNQVVTSGDMISCYTKGSQKSQDYLMGSKESLQEKDTNSLLENQCVAHGSVGKLDKSASPKNLKKQGKEGLNGSISGDETISEGLSTSDGAGSFSSFSHPANPLKAQVPPRDIFSKREMSNFIGNKTISPPSYFRYQISGMEILQHSRNRHIFQGDMMVSNVDNPYLDYSSGEAEAMVDENTNFFTSSSLPTATNGSSDRKGYPMLKTNVSTTVTSGSDHATTESMKVGDSITEAGLPLGEDSEPIEGNMCASSTGVVRMQSRKKAEMFLVRTDGYSCTREKVTESSLAFTHPSTQQQMLMWKSAPKTVLLLKKPGEVLMQEAKEVASYLNWHEKMNVVVEPDVHDMFARIPGFGFVQTFYNEDTSDLHEKVDFVACLGGDGVILHASNLFRGAVPPVVSFNLGSLGFLTSHNFVDYKKDLRQVIHGNTTRDGVYITLRMRLKCEIFRKGKAVPGKVFNVLNEVVIDRGSNPYLSKIECYEHDRLITKVQGDGVIVATPTGSTAYSTAAGGSMVHPNVPCMLFTPICPHSLSFRPVILPDSARLELKIPQDARSNAWVSFDGKRRQQLSRGDSVCVYMSEHPLPTVNKFDQTGDWFHSLIRCLNWNERLDQKAL